MEIIVAVLGILIYFELVAMRRALVVIAAAFAAWHRSEVGTAEEPDADANPTRGDT